MSDSKELNEYYSSVDKNLLENLFKNNNLKNLINLSTKSDLYIFNKKNKKWHLKTKDKLLKECTQIKKKEIKESSLMLSNLAKLTNINEYNTVSNIYSNLQTKIANIDKIVECINHMELSSESENDNYNFTPNIVSFDEIGSNKQVKKGAGLNLGSKLKTNEKEIIKLNLENKIETNTNTNTNTNNESDNKNKSQRIYFNEEKEASKKKKEVDKKDNIIKLNLADEPKSSTISESYIECYGNC